MALKMALSSVKELLDLQVPYTNDDKFQEVDNTDELESGSDSDADTN